MENINEHDFTKSMLDKIREGVDSRDNEYDLSGNELEQELSQFGQDVSDKFDVTVFKLYPEQSNVVFAGKFNDLNGMEFQMTLTETDGLFISGNNIQLTQTTLERLSAMKGFYKNWEQEWSKKIKNEYKSR